MFQHNMSEAKGVLTITETSSELFERMLAWLYTGNIVMPETVEEVCQMLMLADEYLLPELKLRCEDSIVSKLTPDNVVDMLIQGSHLPFASENVRNE
jgi:speckle-type POZ protein